MNCPITTLFRVIGGMALKIADENPKEDENERREEKEGEEIKEEGKREMYIL